MDTEACSSEKKYLMIDGSYIQQIFNLVEVRSFSLFLYVTGGDFKVKTYSV